MQVECGVKISPPLTKDYHLRLFTCVRARRPQTKMEALKRDLASAVESSLQRGSMKNGPFLLHLGMAIETEWCLGNEDRK
ncbi:unnamed protein product [Pieris macdunnoughi]|uniref:Uncharacterized protein n=1 Tax=Pieris macdunnoughi TaxID=345717 RepID=A0A821M967_9NEOP|nr:unnamed protein product [Pieris macdunnoughi]